MIEAAEANDFFPEFSDVEFIADSGFNAVDLAMGAGFNVGKALIRIALSHQNADGVNILSSRQSENQTLRNSSTFNGGIERFVFLHALMVFLQI